MWEQDDFLDTKLISSKRVITSVSSKWSFLGSQGKYEFKISNDEPGSENLVAWSGVMDVFHRQDKILRLTWFDSHSTLPEP